MGNVQRIRNIQTFFTVLLVIEIIAFIVLLFAGSFDLSSAILVIVGMISTGIMIALIDAIAGGIEDALSRATYKSNQQSNTVVRTINSQKKNVESAWRDLNGDE